MSKIEADVVALTDIGLVRKRNEDVFLVADLTTGARHEPTQTMTLPVGGRGLILSVFDGMGGAAAGDKASRLAAETFFSRLTSGSTSSGHDLARAMVEAIRDANRRVIGAARSDPDFEGMGTTLTAAGLLDDHLALTHVGDSRAYLLRLGAFVQVTEDQSLAQDLQAKGVLTADEARRFQGQNVVLQALGVSDDVLPFAAVIRLQRGDLLLLCTDGLTNMVPRQDIIEVLTAMDDLTLAASTLVDLARGHGGKDNITLVLARFGGEGLVDPRAVDVRPLAPAKPPERPATPRSTIIALLIVLVLVTVINVIILMTR
jgi:protein phosphatase